MCVCGIGCVCFSHETGVEENRKTNIQYNFFMQTSAMHSYHHVMAIAMLFCTVQETERDWVYEGDGDWGS